ncbi:CapA family protein [Nonomuraea africana]|uniref:Poly-gamma-glutamate synthesis protein (Capsule biosynthesis protein) n=1 Tax=Nonomuraea africana TaxID=46171 RepID=A0ABR9KPT8_9ACTN|nr:CapA family protein [Nonomuraea africana]MBE1564031.1 poly-gamma-glutamate synthesis protein (capsule biosynthesis protein) [Nonomuraea africana]
MSATLALAGDTMLGRGVAAMLEVTNEPAAFFSDGVRDHLAEADLFLLNLECCVSARGIKWAAPGKPFHFRAPPQAAELLAGLGVGCVTLANNHALDYGHDALLDTRDHLERVGIQVVGAGPDEARARRPAILSMGGLRVGVIGVTDHPADYAARPDRPGVAYAELPGGVPSWLTESVAGVRADSRVDIVLVTPHWGPNMTARPLTYVRRAAETLVTSGATLVAGHSAHVAHGVALPVLYDLGDFLDDYAVDPGLRNDLSLLFLVTFEGAQVERLRAVPIKLEYGRTELARGGEHAWISERFIDACAELGTEARLDQGVLTVRGQGIS